MNYGVNGVRAGKGGVALAGLGRGAGALKKKKLK